MKKQLFKVILFFVVAIFFISSCVVPVVVQGNQKKVPPGQMKKATGSKSAKPYAPGQQKKKN